MENAFVDWIIDQLNEKEWSQNELARRSGLSSGTISHIINGTRSIGPEACKGIARALHLDTEYVMRKAGLLPPKEEDTLLEKIMLNIYQKLSPERQAELQRYAEYQLQIQEQQGKYEIPQNHQNAESLP